MMRSSFSTKMKINLNFVILERLKWQKLFYATVPLRPFHTAKEGPVRIQYKCLVLIYVFPEMKLLFQKQNYNVLSLSSFTHIFVRDLYISRIWDWGRAIPRKGIRKCDFTCSASSNLSFIWAWDVQKRFIVVVGMIWHDFFKRWRCCAAFIWAKWAWAILGTCLHCLHTLKKRLAILPSPAGMSLTKLSLAGINYFWPGRVWLVTSRTAKAGPHRIGIHNTSKGVRLPTSLFFLYRKRPPQQNGDMRKRGIVQD